ncbi:hypothetical protein SSS_01897 [Sarcoptes scabiei]|uniref:Uncharacterized protein n=1 Tax=Sarcoptes scabiei TaxID=52283 RepID=A0A834VHH0_SARSC|nr:hypothetical protein SSS_01897 [Sarcoptes scabiei]
MLMAVILMMILIEIQAFKQPNESRIDMTMILMPYQEANLSQITFKELDHLTECSASSEISFEKMILDLNRCNERVIDKFHLTLEKWLTFSYEFCCFVQQSFECETKILESCDREHSRSYLNQSLIYLKVCNRFFKYDCESDRNRRIDSIHLILYSVAGLMFSIGGFLAYIFAPSSRIMFSTIHLFDYQKYLHVSNWRSRWMPSFLKNLKAQSFISNPNDIGTFDTLKIITKEISTKLPIKTRMRSKSLPGFETLPNLWDVGLPSFSTTDLTFNI